MIGWRGGCDAAERKRNQFGYMWHSQEWILSLLFLFFGPVLLSLTFLLRSAGSDAMEIYSNESFPHASPRQLESDRNELNIAFARENDVFRMLPRLAPRSPKCRARCFAFSAERNDGKINSLCWFTESLTIFLCSAPRRERSNGSLKLCTGRCRRRRSIK